MKPALTAYRIKAKNAPMWLRVNEEQVLAQIKEDQQDATAYASLVEAEKALAWVQEMFGFLHVEIEKGVL